MLKDWFHWFRTLRGTGALLLLFGLFALGAAWGMEYFLHLVPCELCLWERRPWRLLIALGALTLVVPRRWARWSILGGLLCLLGSLGLSVLHVGVEAGYWASPAPECHASLRPTGDFQHWLNQLPAQPTKPCDLPDYPFGLPVSLTLLSAFYSILATSVVVWSVTGVFRKKPLVGAVPTEETR